MRKFITAAFIAFAVGAASPTVEAGGLGKAITTAAVKKAFRRDLARDMATAAKPLPKDRMVWRYTTRNQAKLETKRGLAAHTHMTSRVHPGRPLSAQGAQRKFGLPAMPQVRETIRLPKGHPARFNKALRGTPGVGEVTSPTRISRDAIVRVDPIRARKGPATVRQRSSPVVPGGR
jgi:hypothetical protein